MFGRFGKIAGIVVALAVAGCVTRDAYDIRPEENDGVPTAVEWQNAHGQEIVAATQQEELAECVRTQTAADALLAQVKPAYGTDPLVATKIAAVTQFVSSPGDSGCGASCQGRIIWRAALLRAAEKSVDAYRTLYFLEQLRWCGTVDDVEMIKRVTVLSDNKKVSEFSRLVIRELTKGR